MYNFNLLNISAPPDPFVDSLGGTHFTLTICTIFSTKTVNLCLTGASYWLWAAVTRQGAYGTTSSEPWRDCEGDGGREKMTWWMKTQGCLSKTSRFQKIGWMKTHATLYFWGERFPRFQWWTSFLFRYRKDYSYKLYWVSSEAFSLTKWRFGESVSITQR